MASRLRVTAQGLATLEQNRSGSTTAIPSTVGSMRKLDGQKVAVQSSFSGASVTNIAPHSQHG